MVYFVNCNLRVPKSKLEKYKKYILEDIYSLKDIDFQGLTQENNDRCIKLVEETDDYYEIKFDRCTFTAICNVLPDSIITPGIIFYSNKDTLERSKNTIQSICNDDILVIDDLPNLIKQLVVDGCIQKYFLLNNGMFLCVAGTVPLMIGIIDGTLYVEISYHLVFDVNNGFSDSPTTSKLNSYFKEWKEKDDITLPIIPSNKL